MLRALRQLLGTGCVTQQALFPDLPVYSRGLPQITDAPCQASEGCTACVQTCPTAAITVRPVPHPARLRLDLGQCIACGGCAAACPTGTIAADKRTTVAVQRREDLILTNRAPAMPPGAASRAETRRGRGSPGHTTPFRRSLHIREVSTGDNAADLEVAAATNPIFDASRFGIHFVASPRFADALLVTGPVARAMQEPLRRCYDAMAAPRLVIAAGASAISGGLHRGGYAQADGADTIVPVTVYVPGHPPHPWYILHGILLAIGHPGAFPAMAYGPVSRQQTQDL